MIEVKHLVKKYGDHTAVDDLTFSIDKGRIYGFLGPNGAGKSTTMNMITGYLAPTEGQILVDGRDVLKEPEVSKKSIGYLPEIPPVYTDMTVREYLDFVSQLKGIPKGDRKIQREVIMGRLKLRDVADRLIVNLSKGYRQRVGLAQAVMGFPETIILDEPMVGLDPLQIIEIRQLIRSLAKNHTVILSSHILAEVQELCDYILIISKGKLVARDTPENLQKLLREDDQLELEAKGTLQQIKEILNGVSGVREKRFVRKEETLWNITIKPEPGYDPREEIFFAFARAGCPLLSLYENTGTLEDIYLKLTREGGQY
ncbi:ABC transporter ATP-binding protein [bacterium 210820-DFI.6.37]|nr:ABC transporter ATP-binding protein [bacterium 210820-DFI.6.37]